MKKIILSIGLLSIAFIINSCDSEPVDSELLDLVNNPVVGVEGNYIMTSFHSSEAVDINGDNTSSNEIMDETNCFAGNYLILNTDNTFQASSKGVDIEIVGTTETITCYTDPVISGTWEQIDNKLYVTYIDEGDEYTDVFNIDGNKLTQTEPNGSVVGTDSDGNPAYLTANLTIIYTKN